MYSTAVLKIDSASKNRANWLRIPRNSAIFARNSANFQPVNHTNFNLFHYAGNNPVKYVDPDGREAGDTFDSPDAAAKDFANTYNDDSIKKNLEMAAYIRVKDGKYYYDVPHEGDEDKVDSFHSSSEVDIVAVIHTHGAYVSKIKQIDENSYISRAVTPSNGDLKSVRDTKLPLYTVSPDGSLFLTEYKKGEPNDVINFVFPPIYPSDPNCPGRRNNVDAYKQPDNFTISKNEYLRLKNRK